MHIQLTCVCVFTHTSRVAYHTDSGSIHIASGNGKLFGPVTAEGDVIGCGVTFLTCSSKYCTMFLTKNGTPIGTRIQVAVPNGGFYPTIGLVSSEDKVSVKFMDTFKPSPSKLPVGLMRIHNSSYSDHILMYNGGGNGGPANAQFAVALNIIIQIIIITVLILYVARTQSI